MKEVIALSISKCNDTSVWNKAHSTNKFCDASSSCFSLFLEEVSEKYQLWPSIYSPQWG